MVELGRDRFEIRDNVVSSTSPPGAMWPEDLMQRRPRDQDLISQLLWRVRLESELLAKIAGLETRLDLIQQTQASILEAARATRRGVWRLRLKVAMGLGALMVLLPFVFDADIRLSDAVVGLLRRLGEFFY